MPYIIRPIWQLIFWIHAHRVAADGKHAAELALKAGVNIELPNPDCYLHIVALVNEGRIAEGCRITIGGSWMEDEVVFPDPEEERQKITEAVRVVRGADVVILVVGGNEQTSREAWNIYHLGDRSRLELVGMQNELINALHETSKPIVSLVINGRPLDLRNLIDKSLAVF